MSRTSDLSHPDPFNFTLNSNEYLKIKSFSSLIRKLPGRREVDLGGHL